MTPLVPAYELECCQELGWGDSLETGPTPGASGIRAVNLATILGGAPVYLLGFDMGGGGPRQAWWHEGYPRKDAHYYPEMVAYWQATFALGGARDVVNLGPCFTLDFLPRDDWMAVLR